MAISPIPLSSHDIGAIGLGSGFFNGRNLMVGVTKVQCNGTETSLGQCAMESSTTSCQHHAGVICRGTIQSHALKEQLV